MKPKTEKPQRHEMVYGTTTIGEKGQVVIPAEARKALGLVPGEKLLVFGMGREMLALAKLSNLERFASHLASRVEAIRNAIAESDK
jgi:AbrB family looped-hinge helix DNA binding protein